MNFLRSLATRWLVPVRGGEVALEMVFYLDRGLDFDRFLAGMRGADLGWVAMRADYGAARDPESDPQRSPAA